MTCHLIICTDGTWNQPDQRDRIVPSNVVKIARAIAGKTTDNIPQLVYYDTGAGTGDWWDRIKGGASGVGLLDNIKQAYTALEQEFRPEDKLFLFSFSRGAYTARSLAGLIGLCGIPNTREATTDGTQARADYGCKPEGAGRRSRMARLSHSPWAAVSSIRARASLVFRS